MTGRGGSAGGQATVELALVLPLILGLLLGLVQVGLVVHDGLLVVHAAREAARAAAVAPDVGQAREAAIAATRLDPTRIDVELRRLQLANSDAVEVTVTYRSPTAVPVVGALVGDVTLTERVVMRLEVS